MPPTTIERALRVRSEKTKVAVAGAQGFLGRHLCRNLARHGSEVIDLGRIAPDPTDLASRLAGCDAIINCAGRIGGRDSAEAWFANAQLPVLLLEAGEQAGVARFVHVGSVASIPYLDGSLEQARAASARDIYGASKAGGELGVLEAGCAANVSVFVARPPVIYGPGAGGPVRMLISAAAKGLPFPWKDFPARRSMVSVFNLVQALRDAAASSATGGYAICEPEPYSVAEFYDAFCVAFGHSRKSFGSPGRLAGRLAALVGGPLSSLVEDAIFDVSEFAAEFGELAFSLPVSAKLTAEQLCTHTS